MARRVESTPKYKLYLDGKNSEFSIFTAVKEGDFSSQWVVFINTSRHVKAIVSSMIINTANRLSGLSFTNLDKAKAYLCDFVESRRKALNLPQPITDN